MPRLPDRDRGIPTAAPEHSILEQAERWRDDTRPRECVLCEGEREGGAWRHERSCPLGRR
jgi:hypothetical protein